MHMRVCFVQLNWMQFLLFVVTFLNNTPAMTASTRDVYEYQCGAKEAPAP